MRLDHIAYRVKNRERTTKFFEDCLQYKCIGTFDLEFDNGSTTKFNMLAPPETRHPEVGFWTHFLEMGWQTDSLKVELHAPPEIAVSDGPPGSIVGDWVTKTNGGHGGVHHIAYEVADVAATMKEWQEKGYAEFYSDKPIVCKEDDLVQVFSKPSELTGVIYELIKRGRTNKGFCVNSVKALMESTKEA
jgi:catechol 2,3-dioxygenase-like lactoylglutathione lyase family enzyme